MSSFSGPEASALFSRYVAMISGESDRGAVLVAASLLDTALETVLKKKLVSSGKKQDPLFAGAYSPLRSFAAKIELAFRLGLISADTRQMLDIFRDLRNDFAHGPDPVSLRDEPVRNRLREIFALLPDLHAAITGTFEEILQDEPGSNLTLADFLATDRGRRAIFNVFFASNAMALRRVELEVDPIDELKSRDSDEADWR